MLFSPLVLVSLFSTILVPVPFLVPCINRTENPLLIPMFEPLISMFPHPKNKSPIWFGFQFSFELSSLVTCCGVLGCERNIQDLLMFFSKKM